MNIQVSALSVFAGALLSLAAPAAAATYYVATDGSDSFPGTQALPFRTINHWAPVLVPGDTLYVKAGTYPESLYDIIPGGTSWSAPVTVAAFPETSSSCSLAEPAASFTLLPHLAITSSSADS